jgi:hypothetical protein
MCIGLTTAYAKASSTTSVIMRIFSSSSFRPTSCKLTGIPSTFSALSIKALVENFGCWPIHKLTILLRDSTILAQRLGRWICEMIFRSKLSSRERDRCIIEDIINTSISDVFEVAMFSRSIRLCRTCKRVSERLGRIITLPRRSHT